MIARWLTRVGKEQITAASAAKNRLSSSFDLPSGHEAKTERAPIRSTHLQKMTGTRRGEKIAEFQI